MAVNKQTVSEHDAEMRMLASSLGECERLADRWPSALNAAARQQWPTVPSSSMQKAAPRAVFTGGGTPRGRTSTRGHRSTS
eukprot:5935528-Alexandrium_andersonii.AAC.1